MAHVRHDVGEQTAVELLALAAAASPWTDPGRFPRGLDAMLELMGGGVLEPSLISHLPHGLPVAGAADVVVSGTRDGQALLDQLAQDGVPSHLADAGFASIADFWPPWCAVMDGGEIAAMCFAARLTDLGAAAGVYTFPAWRGRGLAGVATAAWSSHPDLADLELGYSTLMSNTASQRVAARLGLPRIGLGLRIA
ncbi:hypothetical protein [Phenylobacterium sp.]|uniref:GNAT family N-acetyltransferase n=1 Tax=Phenylobacterium sp. TaxID=1871053 RepID=UPI002ED86F23